MRKRKTTTGKVIGVKFILNEENDDNNLKTAKAQILKELEEKEENTREWYDKELDKNLKKQ